MIMLYLAILLLVAVIVASLFMIYCTWPAGCRLLASLFIFTTIVGLAILIWVVSLVCQFWPLREGLI